MKKNYIFTLLLCSLIVLSASAKQPGKRAHLSKEKLTQLKSQRSSALRSLSNTSSDILLSEDFSKFTAGSETTPDATDIADLLTGEIPSTYTQEEGWYGAGVYQAGGKAYIDMATYEDEEGEYEATGYLDIPLLDFSEISNGSISGSIKLKSTESEGDVFAIDVYAIYEDNSYELLDYNEFEFSNQWNEYTFSFENITGYILVQIYAYESPVFIDDIEISTEEGGTTPSGDYIFYETFGETGGKVKAPSYTDYDNTAPVTFTCTTTDSPDIRTTTALNAHVWFAANKETDLVISNIPTAGYSDLKLSFDIASGAANTNLNKVIVEVNNAAITVPSVDIPKANSYVNSGEIAINAASTIKLRFYYTVANNPTNFGYRLDNVKITGTSTTGLNEPQAANIYLSNGQLIISGNISNEVEIYHISGTLAAKYPAQTQTISTDTFAKGIYLVKVGNETQKIVF